MIDREKAAEFEKVLEDNAMEKSHEGRTPGMKFPNSIVVHEYVAFKEGARWAREWLKDQKELAGITEKMVNEKLQVENARMRKALEWYSKESNFIDYGRDDHGQAFAEAVENCNIGAGSVAREALKVYKGGDDGL